MNVKFFLQKFFAFTIANVLDFSYIGYVINEQLTSIKEGNYEDK